jgi:virginiamycin A acetyltransferase
MRLPPTGETPPTSVQTRWAALPAWLRGRLSGIVNPHNETRIHLAHLIAKRGYVVGHSTYGRPRVRFMESGQRLSIGRYGSIADGVELLLGGNHRTDWVTTYPFPALPGLWPEAAGRDDFHTSRGPISIGHDVWIGSQAMILSGVTVGHGAVIAARAVVTRDVRPYAIVAGNPAREIRRRFDDATVERLLASAWWDWPRERVIAALPTLMSGETGAVSAG